MQLDAGKTRINLSFSFVAVVTMMLLLCDEQTVLISLFSSFFHEGGHLLFMLIFSEIPERIVFGAFGIRIEADGRKKLTYKKEALISMGGIIGNLVLVFIGLVFYLSYKGLWSIRLVAVNCFIAFFNMLPVSALDFGRCLEIILSQRLSPYKAERLLRVISVCTSVILVVLCILYSIFIGFNISLVAVTVYIILITTLKE